MKPRYFIIPPFVARGFVENMNLHRFVKRVHTSRVMGFSPGENASLRNSDRNGVRYVRKIYKWGSLYKTRRSLAVDRQRGARCFIVSSLLAIPSPLCTRIWLSSPRNVVSRIAEDVARQGEPMLNLAFIVNGCAELDTPVLRLRVLAVEKRGGTRHLRLKKRKGERDKEERNPSAFQRVVLKRRDCDESVIGSFPEKETVQLHPHHASHFTIRETSLCSQIHYTIYIMGEHMVRNVITDLDRVRCRKSDDDLHLENSYKQLESKFIYHKVFSITSETSFTVFKSLSICM